MWWIQAPTTTDDAPMRARSWSPTPLVLAFLCAAGTAHADDWASLGLDAPRSRLSAERSGTVFGPSRWEHSLPPQKDLGYLALMASPAVADGYLVFGTSYDVVTGLREVDGQRVWEFAVKDAVQASPAIA